MGYMGSDVDLGEEKTWSFTVCTHLAKVGYQARLLSIPSGPIDTRLGLRSTGRYPPFCLHGLGGSMRSHACSLP